MPEKKATASFIEPRLLQRTEKLLEGPDWLIELLCGGPHNSSSVASEVMWRSSKDALGGSVIARMGAT
jgi:hypothetical protein